MTESATTETDALASRLRTLLSGRDEPVRITVGNLKGGTGKSITAIELALALDRYSDQPVQLVDGDGANGTSYEWSELAGEDWPSTVTVNYWPSLTLAKRVQDSGHTGHLVIDTGIYDPAILRQALMVTDYLVIPLTASPAEVVRLQPTLAAAEEVAVHKPIGLSILFTRTKANTIALRESREALADLGLHVLHDDVPFLQLYSQAYGTVPDDLGVYPSVLEEILLKGRDNA